MSDRNPYDENKSFDYKNKPEPNQQILESKAYVEKIQLMSKQIDQLEKHNNNFAIKNNTMEKKIKNLEIKVRELTNAHNILMSDYKELYLLLQRFIKEEGE